MFIYVVPFNQYGKKLFGVKHIFFYESSLLFDKAYCVHFLLVKA